MGDEKKLLQLWLLCMHANKNHFLNMPASKSDHLSIHEKKPRHRDHIDIYWLILIKTISKMKPRLWTLLKTKLQQNLISYKLRHNMCQRYWTLSLWDLQTPWFIKYWDKSMGSGIISKHNHFHLGKGWLYGCVHYKR